MTATMKELDVASFPLEGLSLIEASAGTGKTWTIARLYLRALLEQQRTVQEILVVTFTNAATQELRGRIRELIKTLLDRVIDPSGEDREGLDPLFGHRYGNDEARRLLQQALLDFDEAAIYSIHGFAQRAQGIYPLETGAQLVQELLEDETELRQQALRDFWRIKMQQPDEEVTAFLSFWPEPDRLMKDVGNLLDVVNRFDLEAERQRLDRLVAEIDRLEKTIQMLFDDFDVRAALTEDKAWNGSRLKKPSIDALLDELLDGDTVNFSVLQEHRFNKYLRHSHLENCVRKDQVPEHLEHELFRLVDDYLDKAGQVKTRACRIQLLDAAVFMAASIQSAKEQRQAISFDDQIRCLEQAVRQLPELSSTLAQRYPVAMVDEFQDTDPQQYEIFKQIYRGRENTALIMIGDPKQAIYSFRGADVFTYQKARSDAGDDRQFTLAENYRSTPELVNAVNALFTATKNPFIFDRLMTFQPVRAGLNDRKLLQQGKTARPLCLMAMPWQERPANRGDASHYFSIRCADEIAGLLGDTSIELADRKDSEEARVQARDIAVLVRTSRQGMMIRQALLERGIGSAMIQRDSVFASQQAQDIALLLEFLIDPSSTDRLHGLLSTDLFGLDAAAIAALQQDNEKHIEWLETFRQYRQLWERKGLLAMIMRLFDEQRSIQRQLKTSEGERRITNWLQIVELLQQEARGHARINHGLSWLIAQISQSGGSEAHQLQLESDRDLVRILTIHKSKGLQYPIVFLPFAWEDQIETPHNTRPACYRTHDDQGNERIHLLDDAGAERWRQEQLAEHVRLIYVALTRAEYRCYLGWGHVANTGESALAHCLYSQYLDEKGKKLSLESEADYFEPWKKMEPHVEISDSRIHATMVYARSESSDIEKPLIFDRPLQQQWRVSSFTQMALGISGEAAELPEHDAWTDVGENESMPEQEQAMTRFHFEKGARAGSFLHDLLENHDFTRPFDVEWVETRCAAYGVDEHWAPVLTDWLNDVLHKDLDGFCLNEIDNHHKIAELEFYLDSRQLSDEALNKLMHDNGYLEAHRRLGFGDISGFLKGFIDLVCEHDGRYFVIDYKSNHLGYRYEDYNAAACKRAMHEHHYHLQFLIYCLALHRHLKQRLPDYDYDRHFGGVRYLFLRGITTQTAEPYGIYSERPSRDVIISLDRLFGGEGT